MPPERLRLNPTLALDSTVPARSRLVAVRSCRGALPHAKAAVAVDSTCTATSQGVV
jgi:hypothetical protein